MQSSANSKCIRRVVSRTQGELIPAKAQQFLLLLIHTSRCPARLKERRKLPSVVSSALGTTGFISEPSVWLQTGRKHRRNSRQDGICRPQLVIKKPTSLCINCQWSLHYEEPLSLGSRSFHNKTSEEPAFTELIFLGAANTSEYLLPGLVMGENQTRESCPSGQAGKIFSRGGL